MRRQGSQVSMRVARGSVGKDSDAGRDWGQEEKGTTEDEMVAPVPGILQARTLEWIAISFSNSSGLV